MPQTEMADIPLIKTNAIRIVGLPTWILHPIPTGGAITAGQGARMDTTTGKLIKSLATTAPNGRLLGIAPRTPEAVGLGLALLRKGFLDGYDLSALDYDAPVYLGDSGNLSPTAGTVSIVVGRVVSAWGMGLGNAADKIVMIDL